MKRVFYLLAAVLLLTLPLLSQPKPGSSEYYRQKSKRQLVTGVVLFGGGTALVVAGIIIGSGNTDASDLDGGPNFDEGMWLVFPGVAAELASIPFFLSARKNRWRSANLSLETWKPDGPVLAKKVHKTGLALTLRVPLR